MTTSGSTNNKEWYNKTKAIRVVLDFRMKQLCNVKLQYIQQSLFGTIMQNRTFTEAAARGVLLKKAALNNFEIFTGNHLKAFIKRDSNTSVFLWILQNF